MKLPVRLTNHARMRLEERTSLSESTFVALLENYRTVSVGYRRECEHWHRLLFSEPDRTHFVALQHIANGAVITVLPLEYYESMRGPVEEGKKRRAVLQAARSFPAVIDPPAPAKTPTLPPPGVKVNIIGVYALKPRKLGLGTYRFPTPPRSPHDALSDAAFVTQVFEKLRRRGAHFNALEEILLCEEETSHLLKLPWDAIEPFRKKLRGTLISAHLKPHIDAEQ